MVMTDNDIKMIVEIVNRIRRNNKNSWYTYYSEHFGIKIKGYKTWIQRIEYGSFHDGSPMEMKVSEFKQWLENWLKEVRDDVTT